MLGLLAQSRLCALLLSRLFPVCGPMERKRAEWVS
jgi:hypothetical protein